MLMSCRALGRGVEDSLLHAAGQLVSAENAATLRIPFVTGPRNSVAADFLIKAGLRESSPGMWEIAVRDIPALPPYVQLVQSDSAPQLMFRSSSSG